MILIRIFIIGIWGLMFLVSGNVAAESSKKTLDIVVGGDVFHSIEEYREHKRLQLQKEAAQAKNIELKPKESLEESFEAVMNRVDNPRDFVFDAKKVKTINITPSSNASNIGLPFAAAVASFTIMSQMDSLSNENDIPLRTSVDPMGKYKEYFLKIDPANTVFPMIQGFEDGMGSEEAIPIASKDLDTNVEAAVKDVEVPLLIISGEKKIRIMALTAEERDALEPASGTQDMGVDAAFP